MFAGSASAVLPVSVCQYVSPSLFPNGVTSRAPEPVRQRETLSQSVRTVTYRDTEKGEKTLQERDDSGNTALPVKPLRNLSPPVLRLEAEAKGRARGCFVMFDPMLVKC